MIVVPFTAPCIDSFTEHEGQYPDQYDYPGQKLSVSTPEDCKTRCLDSKDCTGYVWTEATKECLAYTYLFIFEQKPGSKTYRKHKCGEYTSLTYPILAIFG